VQIFLITTFMLFVVHRVARCATLNCTLVYLRSLFRKDFQKIPDGLMYFFLVEKFL